MSNDDLVVDEGHHDGGDAVAHVVSNQTNLRL